MTPTSEGSFRLFRFADIQVYLHWSWLLVAFYVVQMRVGIYSTPLWNAAEYVSLFAIVLLHEFGHALACRQTGGRAEEIVLWPFGGVAYVQPPPRPGAQLWSIVAGPLVNVLLVPVLFGLVLFAEQAGWPQTQRDVYRYLSMMWMINLGLLIFNMLPIFPLDGGQTLRSLLWFWLGPVRSLTIATGIGFVGVAWLALYAWERQSIWLGLLAVFIFLNCRSAWVAAREAAKRVAELERRDECFLGDIDAPDGFHAFFAFLLFFEELALSGDIAPITFRGDVFALSADAFAGNDFAADGSLDRD
jgi:Zn-dependent protease